MPSQTRVILDPKLAGEIISPSFDFFGKLNQLAGETIASVQSVTASVWSGVDPTPSAILTGSNTIVAPSIVQPGITGGVAGVIYLISVLANTSSGGRRVQLDGLLYVKPAGM